jgi:hypothetical protein
MVLGQLDNDVPKNEVIDPYLTPYIKINSRTGGMVQLLEP